MRQFTVDMTTPLEGEVDVETIADRLDRFVLKGMFFGQMASWLGDDKKHVLASLRFPPRGLSYLPFKDYGQGDYVRLTAAVARRLHPDLPRQEAFRRLARRDFDEFARSMWGRVVLAIVPDAASALMRVPQVYERVTPKLFEVETKRVDDETVLIRFAHHPSIWGYQIGQFEGVVRRFGGLPRTTVTLHSATEIDYLIEVRGGWSASEPPAAF